VKKAPVFLTQEKAARINAGEIQEANIIISLGNQMAVPPKPGRYFALVSELDGNLVWRELSAPQITGGEN